MKLSFCLIFLLTLIRLLEPTAEANVGEVYGFGSRAGGLAGAAAAGPFDGYAAYANPAGLALEKKKRLAVSYGLIYMKPAFKPIDAVVTSNTYTSDALVSGTVDTSYRPTFGQALGLRAGLAPESFNLSAGMVLYLPLEQVAVMDTGPAFQPEYVLYRGRTQRPQIELGLGGDLGAGFHLGVGLHVGYSVTSNAELMIQTASNTASSMRLASTLKPRVAPTFGLLFAPAGSGFSGGVVARTALSADNDVTLKNGARVIGNLAALDFALKASSAYYYDPFTVEFATRFEEAFGRTMLQLEYQAWSQFVPPTLSIDQPSITSCSGGSCPLSIQPSHNPSFDVQNIWVPRIGQELDLTPSFRLRAGYAYKPSMFRNLPTGAGNLLDPPKHILTAGIGTSFDTFLGWKVPCTLDFHGAYHLLQNQVITKTAGNEAGITSDQKIGAPGYTAGGSVWGGGTSFSVAL